MEHAESAWRTEHRLDVLVSFDYVRFRIQQAAQSAKKPMSAEDFISAAAKPVSIVTGLPMSGTLMNAGGFLSQQLAKSLGIKVQRSRTQLYAHPVGAVLVAVLCALADSASPVRRVLQGEDGCVLEAKLLSNWLTWEGTITVAVAGDSAATRVEVGINVGQAFDWGRSNRMISTMLEEINRDLQQA